MRSPIVALAVLVAFQGMAVAAPMDDRNAALEILSQKAMVERKFSNCRWIRGVRDDALLSRWRKDNSAVSDAAMAIFDSQGGLTRARAKTVEDLTEINLGEAVQNRDACKSFMVDVRRGAHDLSTLVQAPLLSRVLSYAPPQGDPLVWTVEQRRQPTGVLVHSAKRWSGDGSVAACEAETASRPHVFLRRQIGADMQPVSDPDPDQWYAECVESPVDPVTGEAAKGPA